MSFGRVVHEDRQRREQAYRDAGKRCARMLEKAGGWVAEHMPETVDEKWGPNPLVVAAALGVRDLAGEGNVNPGAVRDRLRAHHPWAYDELYGNTEQGSA